MVSDPQITVLNQNSAISVQGQVGPEKSDAIVSAENKVLVFTINWNAIEMTAKCIDALNAHTDRKQIHLTAVDNGSISPSERDALLDYKKKGLIDSCIFLESHVGYSNAFNVAADSHNGELFCQVNNDCIVTEGWFDRLRDTMVVSSQFAAVCANAKTSWDELQPQADREIPHLKGAVVLLRRSVWNQVGEFDAAHFSPAYGEELDWSYRAICKGYRLGFSGNALVYHLGSYTASRAYSEFEVRKLRLTNRIKCRLFNWTIRRLILSVPKYFKETRAEVNRGTSRALLAALADNAKLLPDTCSVRWKRDQVN
jgi:GT2 family glycosyltransferase